MTLEVDRLERRYGDVVALDGLSFRVEAGRLVGFLGPNGAGKTTAMRIIMGIVAPDAGEVRWNGGRVGLTQRLRFGYMPEERGLYPKMRIHEQLVYLARLHGVPAPAAATAADGWIERMGLAERRDDAVEELSLGNQQRVQLAAALVHEPDVLVLDEPFSGLDPIAVDLMSEVLRAQAQRGVAVVFSSHQLDLVEGLCDSVAILAAGRPVLVGEVDELKRRGRERLLVGVDAAPGWEDALLGVEIVEARGDAVLVTLDPGTDRGQVLAQAQAQGTLTHFSAAAPTLTELFRDAVGGRMPRDLVR